MTLDLTVVKIQLPVIEIYVQSRQPQGQKLALYRFHFLNWSGSKYFSPGHQLIWPRQFRVQIQPTGRGRIKIEPKIGPDKLFVMIQLAKISFFCRKKEFKIHFDIYLAAQRTKFGVDNSDTSGIKAAFKSMANKVMNHNGPSQD